MKRRMRRHHEHKGIIILDLLYKLFVRGKLFHYRKTLQDRQYRHHCFTHGGRAGSLDNGILIMWTWQVGLFFMLMLPEDIKWYLRKHEIIEAILIVLPLIAITVLLKDSPWYYTHGRLSEIDLDVEYKEQPLAIRILYQLAYIFLSLTVMALPFIVGYSIRELWKLIIS